jgi:acyl-coenzyme A thioesterase PaaI-like protein
MSSPSPNPFREIFSSCRDLDAGEREAAVTEAVAETIPFMGTAGVEVETYTPEAVAVALPDRPAIHNHVGTPHAAALALLAEAATGLVVALNLPDGAVPLLRSMNVDFRRMAQGRVTATARLDADQQNHIGARAIGRVSVDVTLDAGTDEPPVTGTLQWAWIPERRLAS